jgi:hypothetical protein
MQHYAIFCVTGTVENLSFISLIPWCSLMLYFVIPCLPAVLYFTILVTKMTIFYSFFTPFLISPKGERFCSFPPGGRLGWGYLRNKKAVKFKVVDCYLYCEVLHGRQAAGRFVVQLFILYHKGHKGLHKVAQRTFLINPGDGFIYLK